MEILFIRHGESTANKEKAFQGWTDVELSNQGREQAKKLNQHFLESNIQFDKIYSSPLQRALETAQALIPCSSNSDIETKQGLKSINVGHWSGLSIERIKENHSQEYWKWKNETEKFCFPDGESIADVLRRAKASVLEILSEIQEENNRIAIVTHMITIKVLTLWMLRIKPSKIWEPQYSIPNTGIVVFKVQEGNNTNDFQFERKFLIDPVPHLQ